MDVAKIAQDKLNSMVEDGTIDKLVTEQVTKALTNIIGESFGQWGEWGKKLKEVVSEKMQINLDTLSIPAYNAMVISTIESHLTDTIAANSVELIKSRINDILDIPDRTEWDLSDICKIYWQELFSKEDKSLHLEVSESGYGSIHVRIGTKSSRYSGGIEHEIHIGINTKDKKVFYAGTTQGGNINPLNNKVYKGKIESILMTMWVYKSILNIDVRDAYDIDIEYEEE